MYYNTLMIRRAKGWLGWRGHSRSAAGDSGTRKHSQLLPSSPLHLHRDASCSVLAEKVLQHSTRESKAFLPFKPLFKTLA